MQILSPTQTYGVEILRGGTQESGFFNKALEVILMSVESGTVGLFMSSEVSAVVTLI